MQVEVHEDHEAASRRVATLLRDVLRRGGEPVLLLATGNSPMRAYELLAADGEGPGDAIFVQLDEYEGVEPDDYRSLYGWMRRGLLDPLGAPDDRVLRLDPAPERAEQTCREHDAAIAAAGGIDLALLGLGPNGHLGFNEPPSPADAPSRVVELTPESVASNAAYWGSEDVVPRRALTTGMRPILDARRVVLLATGARKREILRRTLYGPITPDVPASLLRQARGEVLVVADRASVGAA